LNLPGHGESTVPTSVKVEDLAEMYIEFMEKEEIVPKYIVGYSIGGGVATAMRANENLPQSVSRIIAVDPLIQPVDHSWASFLKTYFVNIPIYWLKNGGSLSSLAKVTNESWHQSLLILGNKPSWRVLTALQHTNLQFDKTGIDITFLWGTADVLFPVPGDDNAIAKNDWLKKTDGDHIWPLRYPERFVNEIVQILEG